MHTAGHPTFVVLCHNLWDQNDDHRCRSCKSGGSYGIRCGMNHSPSGYMLCVHVRAAVWGGFWYNFDKLDSHKCQAQTSLEWLLSFELWVVDWEKWASTETNPDISWLIYYTNPFGFIWKLQIPWSAPWCPILKSTLMSTLKSTLNIEVHHEVLSRVKLIQGDFWQSTSRIDMLQPCFGTSENL